MTTPGPILDYASPRKQSGLRLASKSTLDLQSHADGATVIESLRGKTEAVAAMIFALFILFVLAVMIASEIVQIGTRHPVHTDQVVIFLVLWLVEAIVLVMVVDQTWRKTILDATPAALVLRFVSPFSRRRYEWAAEELAELRVVTGERSKFGMLGELQIHPHRGEMARLFIDHFRDDIAHCAAKLRHALNMPSDGSSPTVAPPKPIPVAALARSQRPDESR